MPDRKAETFQTWLEARPGVEIISRDRGERYATGGKTGTPNALHVADRWHLLHNWSEVVERVLRRHQTLLRQVKHVKALPPGATAATLLPPKSVNRRRLSLDARREQVQRERFELWTTIRERHAKGASLKDIERALRLNYKTVRKYAPGSAAFRGADGSFYSGEDMSIRREMDGGVAIKCVHCSPQIIGDADTLRFRLPT